MKSNWINYIFIIFIIFILGFAIYIIKADEKEQNQEKQADTVKEKNTELKLGIARNRYNKPNIK